MISAKLRFHGHGSLRYLHKNADVYRSKYCVLKIIANPKRKYSRFAVIVSKKTHKSAVGRNRIRRRIYEMIRLEMPNMIGVNDMAIIVTSGEALTASHQELFDSLHELMIQSGKYRPQP